MFLPEGFNHNSEPSIPPELYALYVLYHKGLGDSIYTWTHPLSLSDYDLEVFDPAYWKHLADYAWDYHAQPVVLTNSQNPSQLLAVNYTHNHSTAFRVNLLTLRDAWGNWVDGELAQRFLELLKVYKVFNPQNYYQACELVWNPPDYTPQRRYRGEPKRSRLGLWLRQASMISAAGLLGILSLGVGYYYSDLKEALRLLDTFPPKAQAEEEEPTPDETVKDSGEADIVPENEEAVESEEIISIKSPLNSNGLYDSGSYGSPRTYTSGGFTQHFTHWQVDAFYPGNASGPVMAMHNGKVVWAGNITFSDWQSSDLNGGWYSSGEVVAILGYTPDGYAIVSYYAHLASGTYQVKVGDIVQQGQMLATMGQTGAANTLHLHVGARIANQPGIINGYEEGRIIDGRPIDIRPVFNGQDVFVIEGLH